MNAAVVAFDAAVSAHEAELQRQREEAEEEQRQPRQSEPPAQPPGVTPQDENYLDHARRLLNEFGGGYVSLVSYDGWCGNVYSEGCTSPGEISIAPGYANMSENTRRWLVMHEFAHIKQFERWDELWSSDTYATVYGYDVERMANCMAQARGIMTSFLRACSQAELEFARSYW